MTDETANPLDLEAILIFHRLIALLANTGCTQASISFSGSGDSGSMHEAAFEPMLSHEIRDEAGELMQEFAYGALNSHGYDYVNNGGGSGELSIDFKDLTWKLDFTGYTDEWYEDEVDERPDEEGVRTVTTGVASEQDLRKCLELPERENRAETISILPTLLPLFREREKEAEVVKPKGIGIK